MPWVCFASKAHLVAHHAPRSTCTPWHAAEDMPQAGRQRTPCSSPVDNAPHLAHSSQHPHPHPHSHPLPACTQTRTSAQGRARTWICQAPPRQNGVLAVQAAEGWVLQAGTRAQRVPRVRGSARQGRARCLELWPWDVCAYVTWCFGLHVACVRSLAYTHVRRVCVCVCMHTRVGACGSSWVCSVHGADGQPTQMCTSLVSPPA